MILFKPWERFYIFSGLIMTVLLVAGVVLAVLNSVLIDVSNCHGARYGQVATVNASIFLIITAFVLGLGLLVALLPLCKGCCARKPKSAQSIAPSSQDTSQKPLTNTQEPAKPEEPAKSKEEQAAEEKAAIGGGPDEDGMY